MFVIVQETGFLGPAISDFLSKTKKWGFFKTDTIIIEINNKAYDKPYR